MEWRGRAAATAREWEGGVGAGQGGGRVQLGAAGCVGAWGVEGLKAW